MYNLNSSMLSFVSLFFFFGFFLEKILCHLSKNYKIYKVTAERAFFRDTAYHSKVLPKLETLKLYITAPLIYFHGLWNANKWLNKSRYHPATGTEEEGNSQPTCTDCFYMTRFFILFFFIIFVLPKHQSRIKQMHSKLFVQH